MTSPSRIATATLLAASLALGFAACKPIDKDAGKQAKSDKSETTDNDIAKSTGLKTEKQQASYMIGMTIGKQLQPVKSELDLDTMNKALKTMLDGGKPLLSDAQAQQIAQALDQRLQAKQMAEMQAAAKKNAAEGETFLAANTKKPEVKTTASGLQYEVLSQGKGAKPTASDRVKVNYKGSLLDGKVFDDTSTRGEPAVLSLQQVAPGWAEGVEMMPVGSKYRFWIPAKLGYGEQGTPGGPIPPNATLVFEVELLDILKPDAADAKPQPGQ